MKNKIYPFIIVYILIVALLMIAALSVIVFSIFFTTGIYWAYLLAGIFTTLLFVPLAVYLVFLFFLLLLDSFKEIVLVKRKLQCLKGESSFPIFAVFITTSFIAFIAYLSTSLLMNTALDFPHLNNPQIMYLNNIYLVEKRTSGKLPFLSKRKEIHGFDSNGTHQEFFIISSGEINDQNEIVLEYLPNTKMVIRFTTPDN